MSKNFITLFLVLIFCQQAFTQDLWVTVNTDKAADWTKRLIQQIPEKYTKFVAQNMDFVPGLKHVLSSEEPNITLELPQEIKANCYFKYIDDIQPPRNGMFLNLKFPQVLILVPTPVVTLEIAIKNINIEVSFSSEDDRIYLFDLAYQYSEIELQNTVLQHLIPSVFLNNDYITEAVQNSKPILRSAINSGLRSNIPLIRSFIKNGKLFEEYTPGQVLSQVPQIQFFSVENRAVYINLRDVIQELEPEVQKKERQEKQKRKMDQNEQRAKKYQKRNKKKSDL